MRGRVAVLVVVLGIGGAVAGCGSGTGGGASAANPGAPRVGLVTDPGGLNDRSFNELAYKGLQEAEKKYGVGTRVLTTTTNSEFLPSLTSLAREEYDLVIAVGFQMIPAVGTVAKAFPNTDFAIIDVSQEEVPGMPANVEGATFEASQSGYLAGYAAGSYVKKKGGEQIVSSVGGKEIPPVNAYIAGYQAGARQADPGVRAINDYSQDFTDQAKCKELALQQIEEGSQVVFAVASQCGLGAISAAGEKGVQAVGVDADQDYLGPQVLTSALKKVNVAVLELVSQINSGSFKAGQTTTYDLSSHAVGLGTLSPAAKPFEAQLKQVEHQLRSGELVAPSEL